MNKIIILILICKTCLLWSGSYIPVKFGSLDHDTGNCILTVTDNGGIGFGDSNQTEGSGFWYPKWVNQTIFYGSHACGNSPDYIVDNYYQQGGDDGDWRTVKPIGRHIPPEFGLQEYDCIYDDGHHPTPKGLECFQFSVADASPNCDDFVIIEFIYENKGSQNIDSLYSAIFIDFDIANATDNYGKTDSILRTAYMQPSLSNENPTVGIVYLGSKPQAQLPVANLSVIDHALYVYPNQGIGDSTQFYFMNGTYSQSQSDRQYDWSVVVSVGPFDLAVGAKQHVTFAITGGGSNIEYLQNCQNAIDQYDTMWPGIEEETNNFMKCLYGSTIISGPIRLPKNKNCRVYDISGRTVHVNSIKPGIYFIEIEGKISQKVVKIK